MITNKKHTAEIIGLWKLKTMQQITPVTLTYKIISHGLCGDIWLEW